MFVLRHIRTSCRTDGWTPAARRLCSSLCTVAFLPSDRLHWTRPASAAPWALTEWSYRQRNRASADKPRSISTGSHSAPSRDASRDNSRSEGTLWRTESGSCQASAGRQRRRRGGRTECWVLGLPSDFRDECWPTSQHLKIGAFTSNSALSSEGTIWISESWLISKVRICTDACQLISPLRFLTKFTTYSQNPTFNIKTVTLVSDSGLFWSNFSLYSQTFNFWRSSQTSGLNLGVPTHLKIQALMSDSAHLSQI